MSRNKVVVGTECDNYIKQISPEAYDLVKTKCLDFYVTAAIEIKKRLPVFNDVFEQLKFFDPKCALYDTDENCLDINFKALVEQLNEFFNVDLIQREWKLMQILIDNNEK